MDQSLIQQLVIRAQSNDSAAFAELIGHTRRFAYGSVLRMTGNSEESKDIVQEAYVRVLSMLDPSWRSPKRIKHSANIRCSLRRNKKTERGAIPLLSRNCNGNES